MEQIGLDLAADNSPPAREERRGKQRIESSAPGKKTFKLSVETNETTTAEQELSLEGERSDKFDGDLDAVICQPSSSLGNAIDSSQSTSREIIENVALNLSERYKVKFDCSILFFSLFNFPVSMFRQLQQNLIYKYLRAINWLLKYYYDGVCSSDWFIPYIMPFCLKDKGKNTVVLHCNNKKLNPWNLAVEIVEECMEHLPKNGKQRFNLKKHW